MYAVSPQYIFKKKSSFSTSPTWRHINVIPLMLWYHTKLNVIFFFFEAKLNVIQSRFLFSLFQKKKKKCYTNFKIWYFPKRKKEKSFLINYKFTPNHTYTHLIHYGESILAMSRQCQGCI